MIDELLAKFVSKTSFEVYLGHLWESYHTECLIRASDRSIVGCGGYSTDVRTAFYNALSHFGEQLGMNFTVDLEKLPTLEEVMPKWDISRQDSLLWEFHPNEVRVFDTFLNEPPEQRNPTVVPVTNGIYAALCEAQALSNAVRDLF